MDVPNPIHAEMSLEEARRRLRWRSRRGLLENDLILQRFFQRYGGLLQMPEVMALMDMMELPDNELLDLFLSRTELDPASSTEVQRALMIKLREV